MEPSQQVALTDTDDTEALAQVAEPVVALPNPYQELAKRLSEELADYFPTLSYPIHWTYGDRR